MNVYQLLCLSLILSHSAVAQAMCKKYYTVSGGEVVAPVSSVSAACDAAYIGMTPSIVSVTQEGDLCKTEHDINGDGNTVTGPSGQINGPIHCPTNLEANSHLQKICSKPCPTECPEESGNPIDTLAGYKYQTEIDLPNIKFDGFDFTRKYFWDTDIGLWQFSHERKLFINQSGVNFYVHAAERPSGRKIYFHSVLNGNSEIDYWVDTRGWIKVYPVAGNHFQMQWGKALEEYNDKGQLVSITDELGNITTLTWNSMSNSVTITDRDMSTSVTISYQDYIPSNANAAQRVVRIEDTLGNEVRYSYNANHMIKYVSLPDGTTTTGSNPFGEDNPFRQYHYDDANFPTALTGITDERGVRYATWAYDTEGRAYLSKYETPASTIGIEQVTLDYTHIDDETNPRVIETNALGHITTYYYTTIDDERLPVRVERNNHTHPIDTSVSCVATNQYTSYDSEGNKNIVMDWEGNATEYEHDSRELEISREEGRTANVDTTVFPPVLTLDPASDVSRVVETQWNSKFRLPARISAPNKVTDYHYDCSNGRLQLEQVYFPGTEPTIVPDCS